MTDAFSEYRDEPDSDKTPITEDGSPSGEGDSIHIPAEFLQGGKFKEGDEITLKVVAADEDGVEVEYAAEEVKGDKNESEDGMMSANDEIDRMHGAGMGSDY